MAITGILDSAGVTHSLDDLNAYDDLPLDLALALVHEREPRAVPSASTLTGCLRRFELEAEYGYAVDPRRRLPAFYGNAVHAYLERELVKTNPALKVEVPLTAAVDLGEDIADPYRNLTTTGIMDYWDTAQGIARDWKTKVYLPVKDGRPTITPTPAHIFQVNIYHWMLSFRHDYAPVQQVQIVYLDQKNVAGFAMTPWPLAKVEDRVRSALRIWAKARVSGTLPPPVEGWQPTGKVPAPCSYCDLLKVCRERALTGQ